MKNRRGFLTLLTAVSSAGLGLVVTAKGANGAAATAQTSAAPQKAPSAAALALAATYRVFDPQLSDAELRTIAHGIDDNRAAASKLNPKSKPLRNSDEMVVRFAAAERLRR